MKAFKYILIPVLVLFSSCYIYKPFAETDLVETPVKGGRNSSKVLGGDDKISPTNSKATSMGGSKGDKKQKEEEEKFNKLREFEEKQKMQGNLQLGTGENPNANSSAPSFGLVKNDIASPNSNRNTNQNTEKFEGELTIKQKLQPTKYYKITVDHKEYKIQVDGWEGDTLKAHKLRNPEKAYKFHENQIIEESIKSRRFSKPFSDLFTVGAYAAGGAAVLLLVL